jgi:hypothetical protein
MQEKIIKLQSHKFSRTKKVHARVLAEFDKVIFFQNAKMFMEE